MPTPSRGTWTAVFQNEGRLSDAARELSLIRADSTDDFVLGSLITQALYERNFNAGIEAIERKLRSVPRTRGSIPPLWMLLSSSAFVRSGSAGQTMPGAASGEPLPRSSRTPTTVVIPDSNGTPSTLALAYAGLGEQQLALEQAKRAVTDYDGDAVNKPLAETVLAQIQARFGEMDNAIAALPSSPGNPRWRHPG